MPDSTSLVLASARWLTYLAVLLIVGGAGARVVVSRASTANAVAAIQSLLFTRIERTARLGAWLWCASVAATLAVQLLAWFGADGMLDSQNVSVMIAGTVWGQGWQWTAIGSCGVLAGFMAARVAPPLAPLALFGGALAAALVSPIVGHGGSHGTATWLLHAAHVTGAGLWVGTLAVLLRSSFSLWGSAVPGSGVRPHSEALRALLLSLSPVALTGTVIAVASGAVLALEHVQPLGAILETSFGITLLVKIFVVLDVMALGYLNWKKLGPRAVDPAGRAQLRSLAIAEVSLALVLVLGVTAWLSGLPIPSAG